MNTYSRPVTESGLDNIYVRMLVEHAQNVLKKASSLVKGVVKFTTKVIRKIASIGANYIGIQDFSKMRRVQVANCLPINLMARIAGNNFVPHWKRVNLKN